MKGRVWLSRDASYTVSSVEAQYSPLPSLLTCEGRLYVYHHANQVNTFACHTRSEQNPHIVIDLGRSKTIHNIWIKNRKDFAARSIGLTLWMSPESTTRGEKVWSTQAALDEHTISFTTPRKARFITIGMERRDYLHLQHVKVFGED